MGEAEAGGHHRLARRAYGLLLRPEASVVVVSAALVIYFELANQNFLTNANIQTCRSLSLRP